MGYCEKLSRGAMEFVPWQEGVILPEKLGKDVQPAFQNPYPILGQNL